MDIRKKFAKYVSQNIFGMLGISCYVVADTFFISKFAGADGITVLNLVLPVFNVIFAIADYFLSRLSRYLFSKPSLSYNLRAGLSGSTCKAIPPSDNSIAFCMSCFPNPLPR